MSYYETYYGEKCNNAKINYKYMDLLDKIKKESVCN